MHGLGVTETQGAATGANGGGMGARIHKIGRVLQICKKVATAVLLFCG